MAAARPSTPRILQSKIKSPAALKRVLTRLRRKKAKVVFTNGCFDILHKGHVTYLQQARKLGTHLVVALNTDESVRRLKGPKRPINPLADRLEVLAALESVDFVTWFDQDTPLEIILALKPEVLVKGGDWKPEQIVGSKEARSWGGKTRSLRYIPGKSTTSIIEKVGK